MAWIRLEALVALILAVFIVWFTMGGRRKPPGPTQRPAASTDESGTDGRKR